MCDNQQLHVQIELFGSVGSVSSLDDSLNINIEHVTTTGSVEVVGNIVQSDDCRLLLSNRF